MEEGRKEGKREERQEGREEGKQNIFFAKYAQNQWEKHNKKQRNNMKQT